MTYPPHIPALTRPAAYPPELGITAVKTLETHISYLFLTGKRVYKVKKHVDFGFLTFTTLARRRHFCREEMRLNRRLSPDDVVRQRIQARLAEGKDASHVRWELNQQQTASFEPARGISRAEHPVVDTVAPLPEVTLSGLRKLLRALHFQRYLALQRAMLDAAAHRLSA